MGLIDVSIRIMGEKVKRKIDNNTKMKIAQKIATLICNYDKKMDYDTIFNIMMHGNIKEIVHMGFSGARGIYHPANNTMYLDKDAIESLLEGDIKDYTVIHECLHKLQCGRLFFQGKEIRGFIEGATEHMSQKLQGLNKSTKVINYDGKIVRFNYENSSYNLDMSIINQIEIILGDDSISQFALTGDRTALKNFQKSYGKDLYEKIRKATNIMSKYFDLDLFMELQNEILYTCYDKKFEQIQNIQDSISYLEELRRFELARGKVEGDNTFRDYYTQKYTQLMQIAKKMNVDISVLQDLEYKECEFYRIYEEEEKKEELKKMIQKNIVNKGIKNVSEVKRYEVKINDNSYNILFQNDVPCFFVSIGDYEHVYSSTIRNGNLICMIDNTVININTLKSKDGKLEVSLQYTDPNGEIQVKNMTEVDLGVGQEELDEYIRQSEEEYKRFEGQFEKKSIFSKLFSRKKESIDVKALPEPETKTCQSWELTEEEKRRINESAKERTKQGKTQEGKQDIIISSKKSTESR